MNDGRRATAYVGLGSNQDDPRSQIERAVEHLDRLPDTRIVARSSLYRSAPFGPVPQADFLNAVAALETAQEPRQLLVLLKDIERRQGRRPTLRWGPRVIDLDLLVYGDLVIDEPGLFVPHPGIAERNFVLLPLREVAPDLHIPGLGRVADIAVDESDPRISRSL
jgi:2-amino-4-hydroxy-6-hydroxymethyldihydropteridine diphosphokinase